MHRDHYLKLSEAHRQGMAVSIKLKNIEKTLVVGIQYLVGDSTTIVWPWTLYGDPITETKIMLSDIEKFCVFNIKYDDPYYQYLRSVKKHVKHIRHQILERRSSSDSVEETEQYLRMG